MVVSSMRTVATAGGGAARVVSRVALVLSQLRPGGAERVVVHLAGALRRAGVEPLVLCMEEKGLLSPQLDEQGIDVVALQSRRAYDIRALLNLRRTLRAFRPSVIHVHDYSSLPYAVVGNVIGSRCPLVFTAHGLLYEGFEPLRRRYRLFSRGISALAAVSEPVRDRHVEYLGWRRETHIVPNGVPAVVRDPADRVAVRRELHVPADTFVFLAVGNARPEKGFEDLIGAVANVRRVQPDATPEIWIAGGLTDSDYCNRLRARIDTPEAAGVRLLGFRDDVSRLYSAADALVIPSRSEGLPLVLLEAMMAGLPVIATRVGGIPDAVPDGCGLLVKPGDPESLAGAMIGLMTGGIDSCRAMAAAASRRAATEYSIDAMVRRYLALYASQLQRR